MYDKCTASIILNGEKLETFSPRPRIKQRCPLSSLLFNLVLKVLVKVIKKEKMNQRYKNWKGGSQMIISGNAILHLGPKKSTLRRVYRN